MYLGASNLYRWGMSQKLPKNGFKLVKKLSKFDKEFIENVIKIVANDIFLKQMLNIKKKALNHGLTFKNVHRVIQFNQKAWLKPYIEMNTILRTELKNDFEKDFFKLMKNAVFGKTMENASPEILNQ